MANALAPRNSALAVPTRTELEALGPGDRWTLEERADEIKDLCRELNDDELRQWVEVEGKTQTEIAQLVGRSTSRVSQRCIALGLQPKSNRGRPRISSTGNSDGEEVIDAEVVEDGLRPMPAPLPRHPHGGSRIGPETFSSATPEWATPQDLFDQLHAEFGFDLDVCATNENAKCAAFYTEEQDGLTQPWAGTCWMNPPYGDVIGQWIEKARTSAAEGATVVCLVPARVDTRWFQQNCPSGEIRFLLGRVKFGGGANSAPFPSAVVVFGPHVEPGRVRWGR